MWRLLLTMVGMMLAGEAMAAAWHGGIALETVGPYGELRAEQVRLSIRAPADTFAVPADFTRAKRSLPAVPMP